jgi:membrane-associated protease RseP (regulator of RpoE activity)
MYTVSFELCISINRRIFSSRILRITSTSSFKLSLNFLLNRSHAISFTATTAPVFTHVARHTVANDPRPSVASSSAHLSPTVRRRPLAPRARVVHPSRDASATPRVPSVVRVIPLESLFRFPSRPGTSRASSTRSNLVDARRSRSNGTVLASSSSGGSSTRRSRPSLASFGASIDVVARSAPGAAPRRRRATPSRVAARRREASRRSDPLLATTLAWRRPSTRGCLARAATTAPRDGGAIAIAIEMAARCASTARAATIRRGRGRATRAMTTTTTTTTTTTGTTTGRRRAARGGAGDARGRAKVTPGSDGATRARDAGAARGDGGGGTTARRTTTRRREDANAGGREGGTRANGRALATLGMASAMGIDFEGPGSVITAIGVLAVIITAHECGHFFAARARGIHVNAFAVGFGPNLFTYRGPEVEYSLKAIPLGGYVAFPDDDEDCPYPEDDPDLLRNRPTSDRALVVSAGIIANVLFAFGILYNQVTTVGFAEQKFEPGVVVKAFTSSSVARDAGIEAGDIILSVDGEKLAASGKSVGKVVNAVKNSPNDVLKFELMRIGADGAPEVKIVELRPSATPTGDGKVGVKLESNSSVSKHIASNPIEAASLAGNEFARLTALVWKSLSGLFLHFDDNKSQVSGPIAIVATGAEVMRSDVSGLYQFAAVININLAIVNLLPLPALDGGFLLLIAIEAARGGKKIPLEIEQSITGAGVLFLLISGASLILRDTINLIPH